MNFPRKKTENPLKILVSLPIHPGIEEKLFE
jgi:hypothetical protein